MRGKDFFCGLPLAKENQALTIQEWLEVQVCQDMLILEKAGVLFVL